jgi:multiple sugar transport system permease protein
MKDRGKLRRSALCWAALAPLIALVLFPFAVMLSTALKATPEVMAFPPHWLPRAPSLASFPAMSAQTRLGTAIGNSLLIAGGSVALTLGVAIPAAYALARLRFPAQAAYRVFLLVTQMLAPVLLILGLFRLAASVHLGGATLVDTRLGVILIYAAFQIAFSIWMLSAYFASIPVDVEEAALIDGCSRVGTFVRIVLPLCRPGIVAATILSFIASWNNFIFVLILGGKDTITLPMAVYSFVSFEDVNWGGLTAAATVITLPILVLSLIVQRYLAGGLTMGAVKG